MDSGKRNKTDGKLSQKEMKQSEVTKLGVLKVEEKGENYQKMEKLTRRKQSLVNFSFYRGNQPGPLSVTQTLPWLYGYVTQGNSHSTEPLLLIKYCISSSWAFILQAASFDVITGASLSTLTVESNGSYLNFGLKLNNQVQSVSTDGPKMQMTLCHLSIFYIS